MNYFKIIVLLSVISSALAECIYSNAACDFDLENFSENMEDIVKQLPEVCQEIWNKRGNECKDVYEKTVEESNLYRKVMDKLKDIEAKQYPNPEDEIPNKNWTLRTKLYTNANIYECSNQTVYQTSEKYYDCLITKRSNMLTELNNSK